MISDKDLKEGIENLLNGFSSHTITEAIARGDLPADLMNLDLKQLEILQLKSRIRMNAISSGIQESYKRHYPDVHKAYAMTYESEVVDYLSTIVKKLFGYTCSVDKANSIFHGWIRHGLTKQFKRSYSHPVVSSRKIWKNVIETNPVLYPEKAFEHMEALSQLKSASELIALQKRKFVSEFYSVIFKYHHKHFFTFDTYELLRKIGIQKNIFPLKETSNPQSQLIYRIFECLTSKGLENLYLYLKDIDPVGVKLVKREIKRITG